MLFRSIVKSCSTKNFDFERTEMFVLHYIVEQDLTIAKEEREKKEEKKKKKFDREQCTENKHR